MLARMTGKAMLPVMLCPEKYWTLRSWDKMVIPKPFSRVITMKGDPIFVRSDASRDDIESKRAELQAGLDSLLERCHTLLGLCLFRLIEPDLGPKPTKIPPPRAHS